jgi:hypothetical protein
MQTQNIQEYFDGRREQAGEDPALLQQLEDEIKNHRLALVEANKYGGKISQEVLKIGEFTDDRIAEALGGVVTLDKVGLKDFNELLYVYLHEGYHNRGIRNEGLVQKGIQLYGPDIVKQKAAQDYAEEQLAVDEVARRIGTQNAFQLYDNGDYTKMYNQFRYVCMAEENMSEEDVMAMFFKAFPELKFEATVH